MQKAKKVKVSRLDDMTGGWFVGDFSPSLFTTPHAEVAVQHFAAGYCSPAHYHKVAHEITVMISGVAMMNDQRLIAGDIIVVQPFECVEFRALEATTTVVVKSPSVSGDKYLITARKNVD